MRSPLESSHGAAFHVLSDRQSTNHSFIDSVGHADASIAALVQYLRTRKHNHATFILKKPCDCLPGRPVSSTTSLTVYVVFSATGADLFHLCLGVLTFDADGLLSLRVNEDHACVIFKA